MTPDDYRFHDVFHYAYAAVLGWSPVLRALMSLKRKSEPLIDEAQDGARALLIEEGIATWIFGQAQRTSLFEGTKAGDLSFDLLKNVRQFVAGYEPENSPLWLWEDAIFQGYEAFRFLKQNSACPLNPRYDVATAQRRGATTSNPKAFVALLAEIRLPAVFNPYVDSCKTYDRADAPLRRKQKFRAFFRSRARQENRDHLDSTGPGLSRRPPHRRSAH